MNKAPILSLLACVALVGWLAPTLPTASIGAQSGAGGTEQPHVESQLAVSRADDWLAGQSVLRRQSDGHFYADATVDGQQVRFLVDTGASIVALTGADAEALGIYWDEEDLRPIGRGASGVVRGLPARIARMDVGGLEARDVEAAIIPEGLDVSLLGQSFLSKIENVEISGDEMRLGG